MYEYNIYFSHNGNNEYEKIIKELNILLDDYTIIQGLGYYHGLQEPSICLRVIDLIDNPHTLTILRIVIDMIKRIAKQECVLFTERQIFAKLV